MALLKAVFGEIVGLFVDDGSFAVMIVIWVAALGFGLPRLGLSPILQALLLAAGLAAILLESTLRRARKR